MCKKFGKDKMKHPVLQTFLEAELEKEWVKSEIYSKRHLCVLAVVLCLILNILYDFQPMSRLVWS